MAAAYPSDLAHLTGFHPNDEFDLRARLKELLGLPHAERRALGMLARQVAIEHWSWALIGERLLLDTSHQRAPHPTDSRADGSR